MQGAVQKRKDRKGFTLVEMLAVTAIAAILVAVSIPLVSGTLDRACHAADAANERAARALAAVLYLSEEPPPSDGSAIYIFDAAKGMLTLVPLGNTDFETSVVPYGRCKKDGHAEQYLWIQLDFENGEIKLAWSKRRANGTAFNGGRLCSTELLSNP